MEQPEGFVAPGQEKKNVHVDQVPIWAKTSTKTMA